MASKKEMEATIEEFEKTVKKLKKDCGIEVLEIENAELADKIKTLETENAGFLELTEALETKNAELMDLVSGDLVPDEVEETVKMVWLVKPDNQIGSTESVYGYEVIGETEEGHSVVDVPESRVETELSRDGQKLLSMDAYEALLNPVEKPVEK